MATEGPAGRCPVCDESLPERPPSCFRCETPLGSWWPLDEALAPEDLPVPADVSEARVSSGRLLAAAAAFVAGGALAVLLTRTAQAPTTEPPKEAGASHAAAVASAGSVSPAPGSPGPPVVRYRVQPGDSLWRVAAALTGEGHRWRELWPAEAADPRRLRPGTVLEVEAAATVRQTRTAGVDTMGDP